jgi:hypothetical protein
MTSMPIDRAIDLPPDPHAHPRLLVAGAVERYGRDAVVRWCEDLLAGTVSTDEPGLADAATLADGDDVTDQRPAANGTT